MRSFRLLAKFNFFANDLLNGSKKHIKYLSWKVQNELIDILASHMLNIICKLKNVLKNARGY